MLTVEETRGRGESRRAAPRRWTVSGEGEGERRLEAAAAGDLFLRLLADALDRLAVAEARHLGELAVRRLDQVAVEHLVGRDRALDVEGGGARRPRPGVDEDGAARGFVEVAARALRLLRVAGERAAVAVDEVALVLVLLEVLAPRRDPLAVAAGLGRLVADPGEGVHGAVLLGHPGEELVVHVEGRDARDS